MLEIMTISKNNLNLFFTAAKMAVMSCAVLRDFALDLVCKR